VCEEANNPTSTIINPKNINGNPIKAPIIVLVKYQPIALTTTPPTSNPIIN
jgi:hypothetical protein